MKDSVYCIYDRLSNRYGSVFSSPTDATASRQFLQMFKGADGKISSTFNDYDLCFVGTLSIETGELTSTTIARVIVQDYIQEIIPIATIEKALEKKTAE